VSFFLSVLASLFASEVLGLASLAARNLVQRAARRLPEACREQCEEEWLTHLEGMRNYPKLWQLYEAVTIYFKAVPEISVAVDPEYLPMWVRILIPIHRALVYQTFYPHARRGHVTVLILLLLSMVAQVLPSLSDLQKGLAFGAATIPAIAWSVWCWYKGRERARTSRCPRCGSFLYSEARLVS
jgi:hypothetical protein